VVFSGASFSLVTPGFEGPGRVGVEDLELIR